MNAIPRQMLSFMYGSFILQHVFQDWSKLKSLNKQLQYRRITHPTTYKNAFSLIIMQNQYKSKVRVHFYFPNLQPYIINSIIILYALHNSYAQLFSLYRQFQIKLKRLIYNLTKKKSSIDSLISISISKVIKNLYKKLF